MLRFHERELRASLDFLGDVADAPADVASFARAGVEGLQRLVGSEFVTLSVCDLARRHREVFGVPRNAVGRDAREAFDRHFARHPLVQYHGFAGGRLTRRISDSVPLERFRQSDLYNEYYRSLGIRHVMALPVHAGDGLLVSFVLNRARREFSDRERALLDLLRGRLSRLYARASARLPLTERESDVLRWVAAGKSDAQVAAILGISIRTVQKHLQRVYEKLGVENRTAAARRASG